MSTVLPVSVSEAFGRELQLRKGLAWSLLMSLVLAQSALGQSTTRVNLGAANVQASGASVQPAVSMTPDGRFVAFETFDNLVPGDTNGQRDVYVRDRQTNTTTRVSVGPAGIQVSGDSNQPSISADGRYVSFTSTANALVVGDTNNSGDIFVHDRQTSTTTRVSVATGGTESVSPSAQSTLSADGRYVGFLSAAPNLVANDTNGVQDVFVHDRQTGTTMRVSVSSAAAQSDLTSGVVPPALSADGRYVAFESQAANLVAGDTNNSQDIFRHDRQTGTTIRVSVATGGAAGNTTSAVPSISADGRYVAFESFSSALVAGDTNGHRDVFVHDAQTVTTTRVSVATGGIEGTGGGTGSGRPTLSPDARFVAFHSDDTNLVAGDTNGFFDVFLHDRNSATTTRESIGAGGAQSNGVSIVGRVSADGSLVAFTSAATNLVAADVNGTSEPFMRLRGSALTERVALNANGNPIDFESGTSFQPSLSSDGRFVAFLSAQTNLVAPDTNLASDVYVRDRLSGTTIRASVSNTGALPDATGSTAPTISDDGRFVAFANSGALLPEDTNEGADIYVFDRQTSTISRANLDSAGLQSTGSASDPRLSADGRFVAFQSTGSNLVASDTNGTGDIFVRDRQTGTTTRVSLGPAGAQSNNASSRPSISADGRYVAFESLATNLIAGDTNARTDVFVHDRSSQTTTRVSVATDGTAGNGISTFGRISGDGRYVVFLSLSTNLATGAVGNHIYRHDRQTGQTVQIDVTPTGGQPNSPATTNQAAAVSHDGRYVAFTSPATDLIAGVSGGVFLKDMLSNSLTLVSISTTGLRTNYAGILLNGLAISSDGQHVAFPATSATLVPNDTNEQADMFVHSVGITDEDGDGLPTLFENQFGLDPTSASGMDGGSGDPDGDGQTNAQERAAGTHPRGFHRRYMAEGANSAFFKTRFAIFNPGSVRALGQVRFLKSDGTSHTMVGPLDALDRATIESHLTPELATAEFSTVVESDVPVVVDRQMTWDASSYGTHAETGVAAPSSIWYLAEGSTVGGFSLFYLLQNPDLSTAAQVKVTYLLPAGAPLERTYTLQPKTRSNIWVNSIPELASTDVSAIIEVVSGPPIVVERAMYLSTSTSLFNAGHNSTGVTSPATSWFLAEGSTTNFDEFILLANPGTSTSSVRITYLLGNGSTLVKTYAVGARSRFNIWVDEESFNGIKALAAVDVSAKVEVIGGPPIIVERAMWWPGSFATWAEAHNTPGATQTGTKWALAEGEVAGADDIDTFILLANTSATPGSVAVRLYFEDGTTATKTFNVAANSRSTVWVRVEFPASVGKRFGTVVESTGGTPAQLVVERAMYNKANGVTFAGGSNALATRLQ